MRGLGGKESTGGLPFPLLLLNSWATLEGPCGGAEWSGAGAEWSGVERSGADEADEAEWSGVERSQAELCSVSTLFPSQPTHAKQPRHK